MSPQKEIRGQFEAIFLSDGSQVDKTYILTEHLDVKNFYFFNLNSFLKMIHFLDVIFELFALLNFGKRGGRNMGK